MKLLSIAILGTRGVPPRYGGFETFAAELGRRLVLRGHSVAIYCREEGDANWEGIERIVLPAIRHKYLETVSHAFLSAIDAIRRGASPPVAAAVSVSDGEARNLRSRTPERRPFDVVLVCNAANAFVLPLLRIRRIAAPINVDGVERKRRKWNLLGRAVYMIGEAMAASFSSRVVADAGVIAAYYRARYGIDPIVLTYGSEFPEETDSDVLARLHLTPKRYLLYVSRFEPENHPLEVARAYAGVETEIPLVMVGDAPYAPELKRELQSIGDRRLLLPGALYGADYRTLQRNALLYVQGTEVGGTHPALIEAMRSGGAVLANDTPENREVGGDAVAYFRFDSPPQLVELITRLLRAPEQIEQMRAPARERAATLYNWERVTDGYEQLFGGLTN